jgi:glycosyltransferase involved in cell wall biosynthesis
MNFGECDPKLSIGIMAHNEERHIGETLRSIFEQDVFQRFSTELVIVANGCTDKTAAVARQLLDDYQAVWSARGFARVEEIVLAGKSNAWNQFVHRISSSQASVLALIDADIKILHSNTISSMVEMLESNPESVVCVDRPIKDIEIKVNRTFLERLLVAAAPKISTAHVPLCGQLYCALSSQLRLIRLPPEITCEDGFLRALLLTQGFTRPEDPGRIVMNSNVAHIFASVSTLRELFNHEKWVVAGNIVNALLFERFWAEANTNLSAMTLMDEWHRQDSQWLPNYIQAQVRARGWRLLPRENWTRRWSRLIGMPIRSMLLQLPVVLIATTIDVTVFVAAIRDVRDGRAFRYWGRK